MKQKTLSEIDYELFEDMSKEFHQLRRNKQQLIEKLRKRLNVTTLEKFFN